MQQVMNRRGVGKRMGVVAISLVLIGIGLWWYFFQHTAIKSIELVSPHNYAFQEDVNITLDKPASVYVRYWKKGSPETFRTVNSGKALHHTAHLLLLETDATYEYQIIIDRVIDLSSKVLSFQTRKQSPWLDFNWVKEERPHDASALADGLVMLCYARTPGYIALVDGKGKVRWYWQVDDIGVRAATLTPRGTILAMLRPPKKDEIDDQPKEQQDILNEIQKPMRRGKMGFIGGTAMVEIDLTGKELWRVDLDKLPGNELASIHHDIRMDENHHIHTLYRATKPYDMAAIGGTGLDTLVGDGIVVMDTTGKELWKWSAWEVWDINHDPYLDRFAYDRFHMNALNFDTDGNYLVSVSIEDQIWKVDAKTGRLLWKLGRNGDFMMDTTAYFSFQHSVHINPEGDIMLFDNSLRRKESRALSFSLDTVTMTASTHINAALPPDKYTSRMGSAYVLPNGNLLQTSSKTGSVLVTDQAGKVLWELTSYFVPYRAEYVPPTLWDAYFVKEK